MIHFIQIKQFNNIQFYLFSYQEHNITRKLTINFISGDIQSHLKLIQFIRRIKLQVYIYVR